MSVIGIGKNMQILRGWLNCELVTIEPARKYKIGILYLCVIASIDYNFIKDGVNERP